MPEILITEFMLESQVERIKQRFDTLYLPDLVKNQDEVPSHMAGVRGLIVRNQTQVRGALLEAADSLECVGRLGVGLDNIDMDDCAGRGITVYPAIGANADSVAELAMGAIYALFRGAYLATAETVAGNWPRMELLGREVMGKRLGLLGYGATGRALAWRSRGCGMSRIAYDPFVPTDDESWQQHNTDRAETVDQVLEQADAVSIHLPLTDETRHLIDAEAIAKMKDRALVLNLSRGGIVHEQAMVDGLKSGKLGGAFTDVFEEEPLGPDNIFKDVPNFFATPHVGARTEEAETRVSTMIAEAVMKHLSRES